MRSFANPSSTSPFRCKVIEGEGIPLNRVIRPSLPPLVLFGGGGRLVIAPNSPVYLVVDTGIVDFFAQVRGRSGMIAEAQHPDLVIALALAIARGLAAGKLNPHCDARKVGVRDDDGLVGCFALEEDDVGIPLVAAHIHDSVAVAHLRWGDRWSDGPTHVHAMMQAAAQFLAA